MMALERHLVPAFAEQIIRRAAAQNCGNGVVYSDYKGDNCSGSIRSFFPLHTFWRIVTDSGNRAPLALRNGLVQHLKFGFTEAVRQAVGYRDVVEDYNAALQRYDAVGFNHGVFYEGMERLFTQDGPRYTVIFSWELSEDSHKREILSVATQVSNDFNDYFAWADRILWPSFPHASMFTLYGRTSLITALPDLASWAQDISLTAYRASYPVTVRGI